MKSFLIALSMLLASGAWAIELPDPVLYFDFEEDPGRQVLDLSGNDNDGELTGGSTGDGRYGRGLELARADYVRVPHSDSLNFGDELTVAIWVNLEFTDNQKVIGKSDTGNGWVLGVNGGLYPECWDTTGTVFTATQGSIPVGSWTHLAMTYSADDGNMVLYINGDEVGRVNHVGNALGANSSNLLLGVAPWDPAQWHSAGFYDEVKLYDVAIGADLIPELMAEGTDVRDVSPKSKLATTWGVLKR